MSAPPDWISEVLHSMQSCISDVKAWATTNMLKFNDNKTELMHVTSKRTKHLHSLPTSITMGNAQIPFKKSVKNLGFTLDCHLTMNTHVSNIARTCYIEQRRLASIRRLLTSTATLAPAHTPCLFSINLHTVRQHLVIVHFLLFLLLSGIQFQMMSGVPHHCHHVGLVWRHTCFVQFTNTELYPWSLYICAWFGHVIALLMIILKNALMCIKKITLINHDYLPTLMLLYVVLCIVLAYLMLFAALSNAVCLHNVSFLPSISADAFYCQALSWFIDT